MLRYRNQETVQSLRDLTNDLDKYKYESLLFLVHPKAADLWTKLAASVDDSHSFKYMIAFRPYLFSPQYLASLSLSFSEISNDRLMLNMVHGILDGSAGDDSMSGIINGDMFYDDEYKREYSSKFVKKFLNDAETYRKFKMPELLISGRSDQSIEMAKDSSGIIATFCEDFLENPTRFTKHNFKKIFVPLSVLVCETDEVCENKVSKIPKEKRVVYGDQVYGSKETLKKKILELESLGVTDILFSHFDPDHDPKEVHEFLRELSEEGILS
jgi:alkanesulfonate monooxygenase SsuD/methylene tetrahydromethanopterin reductase-like flavin-dependent oxidoreductase (luciferase family)